MRKLHFVFDAFPAPEGSRFIELEDDDGLSISYGEWAQREDGLVALVIPDPRSPSSMMGVKPLEWIEGRKRDSLGNRWWRGLGVFDHASYRIHHDRDSGGINYVLEGANVAYLRLEDAQAAAQADYATRILSALSTLPNTQGKA